MKLRIVLSALLVVMLSAGFNSKASASPWRHEGRGYCRPAAGYCAPARYCAPRVAVRYQERGYCRPAYGAPRCNNGYRGYSRGCRR